MGSKVVKAFPFATINKSKNSSALLTFLELPAQVKSWLLMKFTDEDGKVNAFEISEYVKTMRLKADEWNIRLLEARHSKKGTITLLTKVKIEFDYANDLICFSLPEYGFPKKQKEALVDWSVVSDHKKYLLTSDGCWGEITLMYDNGVINLIDFKSLCPYTFDLETYRRGREQLTTEEWIDALIGGLNFNPDEMSEINKLTLLQRFLPFVEKRLNAIELSIKGSAKTYSYSELSRYNWMTSGTISRATAFYNNTSRKTGYFTGHDNVIWDEVQTLNCAKPEELQGVLKPYLQDGHIRVGEYCGSADAGLILVGNIPVDKMDVEKHNMFLTLPKMFKESAMLDRFAYIIEGWNIERFREETKAEGMHLSDNYLTEIFHLLRDEFYYRGIVDELLVVEGKCDVRSLDAIKKVCTAYLKLLFPHVTCTDDVDREEFEKYCLKPAIRGRQAVLFQLRMLDSEYENVELPKITVAKE